MALSMELLLELLGFATAAFGAITISIYIRRRHRLIKITASVEVSCSTKSQQVVVKDSIVKMLRESEDVLEAFVAEKRKTKVSYDWECESRRVKGGDWDRSPVEDLLEDILKPVNASVHQSTKAAEEGGIQNEYAYSDSAAAESWIEMAKSVLPPSSCLIVSKGPVYLAKAKEEVVKLWETSSRKLLTKFSLPDLHGSVSALDVDDRWGEVAAGSSDGYLSLWDIASGECVRTWQQFSSEVSVVRMNLERRSVVSAGLEDMDSSGPVIRVWDRRQGMRPVNRVRGIKSLPFKIEAAEDQLSVTEGDCVRQYDLRNLAKAIKEEKVAELLTLCKHKEDDEVWGCEDVEEDDEEDVYAEKGGGGDVSNVFTALNSFLTRSILCKI